MKIEDKIELLENQMTLVIQSLETIQEMMDGIITIIAGDSDE
tara:strand:- start:9185 stop:9310 length:126 start_codon:yes stop_codon:yes gene_type:complete